MLILKIYNTRLVSKIISIYPWKCHLGNVLYLNKDFKLVEYNNNITLIKFLNRITRYHGTRLSCIKMV